VTHWERVGAGANRAISSATGRSWGRRAKWLLSATTALVCAACAPTAAQRPAQAPVARERDPLLTAAASPRKPETLVAQVELLGLPVGRLSTTTCRAPSGFAQHSEVTPHALVRALQAGGGSATTLLPATADGLHVSDYHFDEGSVQRNYQVEYAAGSYRWQFEQAGKVLQGQFAVPEAARAQDLHSALALLRAWRPTQGEQGHFYTVMGRKLWRVEVHAMGPEMVRLGSSSRLARRIDGQAHALWKMPAGQQTRRFSLWLSDDPERVPLRLAADAVGGQLVLELAQWSQTAEECADTAQLVAFAARPNQPADTPVGPLLAKLRSRFLVRGERASFAGKN
jgi:hypothetical protein